MNKKLAHDWIYYLDEHKQDYILIKVTFSEDMSKLTEYVIIYLTLINEKPHEIIKYDCSEKEGAHLHNNYSLTQNKIFQTRPVTYETVEEITGYLERNWRMLKSKYVENMLKR